MTHEYYIKYRVKEEENSEWEYREVVFKSRGTLHLLRTIETLLGYNWSSELISVEQH